MPWAPGGPATASSPLTPLHSCPTADPSTVRELKAVLRDRKELFVRCLTEKLLTYALGRGLESYDTPAVNGIMQAVKAGNYKMSALFLGIVHSDPFQKRRGAKGVGNG